VLWIADVGQGALEEINRQPLTQAGANFGWKRFEGDQLFADVPAPGAVSPVHVYGRSAGCSITGGVAYRGSIEALADSYLFGDFCTGVIRGLRHDGQSLVEVADLGIRAGQVVQFGTDHNGDVYAVSLSGEIRRLVASG
ncbi:MAG: hypothetical protein GXP35_18210, partial [Actinobacteria bacterium]|nr:hypothetical protein [Actinomycetota bacterium]